FYQLLSGEVPYDGRDMPAVMYQHCHEAFPDAGKKVAALPPGVLKVLERASQKDPADRYATATEMLADLDALLLVHRESQIDGKTRSGKAPSPARRPAAQMILSILKGQGAVGKLTWATAVITIGVILAVALHRTSAGNPGAAATNGKQPMPNLRDQAKAAQTIKKLKYFPPSTSASTAVLTARTLTNTVGMNFVRIDPGEFMMGSPAGEQGRTTQENQHRVRLTKPFMMGATVVTQSQWKALMGINPSQFHGDNLPVEKVGWADAVSFCKILS